MKLGSRHKADPSFNMSSMTDVVFLLLIFFIMTSTNITPVGRKVNLPKSSDKDPTIVIQRVAVTIDKDLNLQIDNDDTNEDVLVSMIEERLSPKHEDKNKNVIVVRGDEKVDYGEVMRVVQICTRVENAVVTLQMDPN